LGTIEYPHAPLAPCGIVGITIPVLLIQQDKLTRAFLISQQAVPYRARGGTCCPTVSTPKIWYLEDSSTTCQDGINHLHHSNHYSNHIINPHKVNSHHDRWKTITLTQRHKPYSTSQKDERLVRHS
jgi:hypothetical protein